MAHSETARPLTATKTPIRPPIAPRRSNPRFDSDPARPRPISPPAPVPPPSPNRTARPLSQGLHRHLRETPPRPLPETPRTIRTTASQGRIRERSPSTAAAMVAAALTGGSPPRREPRRRLRSLPSTRLRATPSAGALSPRPARGQKPSRQSSPARSPGLPRLRRRRRPTPPRRPPPQPRLRRTPRRPAGCLPCRRSARQAWRLHRRPHASPARRRSRSRAPRSPGPLFLPRWRRWSGRRRPASS